MIITPNKIQPIDKFQELIANADVLLRKEATNNQEYFLKRDADKFETDIFECFRTAAKKTPFEGNIELISGHKFPDIVIDKIYGVEVKTTKQNHWKSTGNSVFETTRVESVKNIFIYFAKLTDPVDFKYRSYQECLYDIAVTHSPRYLIDMNLPIGNSIFDKMKIDYNELRTMENPVKKFIEYFRKFVVPGEEPWWMSSDEKILLDSKFILFSKLSPEDKNEITLQAMVLFPEIFGNSTTKYQNLATWLASRHGIVDSSLRDRFTAGGQVSITIGNNYYQNVPRIYKNLQDNISKVMNLLEQIPSTELKYYWEDFTEDEPVTSQWTRKFLHFSSQVMTDNQKFIVNLIGYNYPPPKPQFLKEEERKYGL